MNQRQWDSAELHEEENRTGQCCAVEDFSEPTLTAYEFLI